LGVACLAAMLALPLLAAARRELAKFRGRCSLATTSLLAACLLKAFVVGGTKTNGVNNLPPQPLPPQLQPIHGGVSVPLNPAFGFQLLSLTPAPQVSQKEIAVRSWNICGAWDDSFWNDFGDGFVFPDGTNHLSGVEVLASGEVWRTPFDDDAVATLGVPVSIVPGTTAFSCGMTTNGSCRFDWTDAAVGRDPDSLMTASIELFRNGDVAVTTNGATAYTPRTLPFPHSGFGQDAEWVEANFTNAAEILSAGYPQWVDAQVGVGLTNGLYKLTVSLSDDPPETTFLSVGGLSVAVTNSGDYVFLLEKGIEYPLSVFPRDATNFVYSAVDDVLPAPPQLRTLPPDGSGAWEWTEDGGLLWLYEPSVHEQGGCLWLPRLVGSPGVVHIYPGDEPLRFFAFLTDYRRDAGSVQYQWSTGDENISIVTPNAPATDVEVQSFPRWGYFSLSVSATVEGRILMSTLEMASYGTNAAPQVVCTMSVPPRLIVRDKWMEGSMSASAHVGFSSDVATSGVFRVWLSRGGERVETSTALPLQISVDGETALSREFTVDGVAASASEGDVELCCAFEDADGGALTNSAVLTVLSPVSVTVPDAPDTGVCVLAGSEVGVSLAMTPQGAGGYMVQWLTARRKTRDLYDSWISRGTGFPGSSVTMLDAGVFALAARTICGCQSNQTEYVHATSEPALDSLDENEGPCMIGQRNHIGVASTQGLLNIRNVALAHLNLAEYGYKQFLSGQNGFSPLFTDWKCNRFVADIACEAGFTVPVLHVIQHTWPIPDTCFPPLANDWANGNVPIVGWTYLGRTAYPEPGFVSGHPNPHGSGHCGIVDYDGWVISAREFGVTRKAKKMLDGTCGYSKPTEENNEE